MATNSLHQVPAAGTNKSYNHLSTREKEQRLDNLVEKQNKDNNNSTTHKRSRVLYLSDDDEEADTSKTTSIDWSDADDEKTDSSSIDWSDVDNEETNNFSYNSETAKTIEKLNKKCKTCSAYSKSGAQWKAFKRSTNIDRYFTDEEGREIGLYRAGYRYY